MSCGSPNFDPPWLLGWVPAPGEAQLLSHPLQLVVPIPRRGRFSACGVTRAPVVWVLPGRFVSTDPLHPPRRYLRIEAPAVLALPGDGFALTMTPSIGASSLTLLGSVKLDADLS